MKKIILLLISSMFVLFGCGSSASEDQVITVGMWGGTDAEMAVLEEIATSYEEETGWAVEYRVYTDYMQELNTELVGGTAPDVFFISSTALQQLVNDGAVLPLNDLIPEETMSLYYPNLLAPYTIDGEVYAVPKDWSAQSMFCNETLLNEAGSSCDEVPADLLDFPEWANEVQKNMPEGKYVFGMANWFESVFMWLQTGGVELMNEDGTLNMSNPEVVANGELLQSVGQSDGYISAAAAGYGNSDDMFYSGTVAISFTGSWAVSAVETNMPDSEVIVSPLPTFNGYQASILHSTGYGINANSDVDPEQLADFIMYITIDMGTEYNEAGSVLPANTQVAEEMNIEDDPVMGPLMDQVEYATSLSLGTYTIAAQNEWGNLIGAVETGDMTVEEMFAQMDETINSNAENFNG